MVVKFPIHLISIIAGLIICIISVSDYDELFSYNAVNINNPFNILIIDAGHGGLDGGAVTSDGIKESDINLAIAIKLNKLSHLYGITTLMTRSDADIEYPEGAKSISECKKADQNKRLELIWDNPHGILYSIHQNYYPSDAVKGIQVLYGHDRLSQELGELLQDGLCSQICPTSRRVAAEIDDSIYLLKHCNCPAVLIECGFLSNIEESLSLQDEQYQLKIAASLMTGNLQFTSQNRK